MMMMIMMKDESDDLLETFIHKHTSVIKPSKIYSTLRGHWMQSREQAKYADSYKLQEEDWDICAISTT